jgi:type II secretory pathway pseudopilin PulG
MTLVEALLAALVLALVLWLAAGLYVHELDHARTGQARMMIRTLGAALEAYYDAGQAYPLGGPTGKADRTIDALLQVPASAEIMHQLDARLLHLRDGRPECLDPWGRPLRYITADIGEMDLQNRVARNNGEPIFESSGPDGRFGHAGNPAAADDIRSDEPAS